MPEFPQCPKCGQRAIYPKENDEGDEDYTCAACGHFILWPSRAVREQAEDAVHAFRGGAIGFARHWASKLADERAKVARLAEGRW
ncbi:hypothetical protein [Myxococcus virescens]|uniref:Uncharacterized protein n=1 Tax=Myxococcus virescens TaxID=83456 RepID=A0A511HNL6_9BACT|nr:hypothetical protein [Myxococcus virescens]GEL75177.1 hypothetical protein MVI01_69610 [Myxococcus virescens]SDD64557.1 hypothetical protein SAMN04488504_102102 [Myxococcus virescens]